MTNFQIKPINRSQIQPVFSIDPINESKNESIKTGRIYLATIAANISATVYAACWSWSSPIGPKLTSQDTSDSPLDRPITPNEYAWISSMFTVGALMTSPIAGPLADKIGRKKVLLLASLFFILGYVILLIAKEIWIILVGRLILGFGGGFTLCAMPMYVGEISTDTTRGATGAFMPLFMCFGAIYCYCIGPFVSYMVLQYSFLLLPIVSGVVFIFMPETPYYSLGKGQRTEASKALQFLRGQNEQSVEAELTLMENLISNSITKNAGIFEIMKTPASRKALLISVGIIFLQQLSGLNVLVSYTQAIFESANIDLDAAIAAIIIGFAQATIAGIAPFVVNKFGRKTLLLYSAVFMSISLAALGYFFYSQNVFGNTNGISWLPLTTMILYYLAFGFGFGPIPWALISEIFLPNTKAIATTITTTVSFSIALLTAVCYQNIDAMGTYYAFWFFAVSCAGAFFFVLFIVVETKDLSFAEIQIKLNKSS